LCDVRLILGDCHEVLSTLDPESIDIVVTDPPYGIGFVKQETGRRVRGRTSVRRNAGGILGDDKPFDPTPFLKWPCVMFGANHYYDRLPPGGTFHAWDKRSYSTLEDSFSDVEFIWTSWPCKSRIISHLWKGVLQGSEKGKPKYHVSQKPVAVMTQLLEWFTKPGDVILDPFAGSGSTLVACLKTGRSGIGIEVDERYIPIINHRTADAMTPLFV
jgi:site-specific DNA-methyltransferase (adenine-specific)